MACPKSEAGLVFPTTGGLVEHHKNIVERGLVPTLIAAGAYDFYKHRALFAAGDAGMFAVGTVASFIAAFLCVRWLLRYIASHDFTVFAWYRIVFGIVVLVTSYTGWVNWSAG